MKGKINTTIISLFKQIILALIILIVAGCAMPKIPQIIVIDDPLTAEQHNDLGVAYEEKGNFDLAGKEYEKAIKKNRAWVIPYLNLGHLYYRQDKLDQAERALREGLRVKGDHPDLLNNLAWVLMEKGQLKDARALIDKAIAMEDKEEYQDTRREIIERIKEKQ
jgi:Flp pilus assembly protein TadD